MSQQTLTEATLLAPVFTGTDEEVAAATQSWSSLVSSLSYATQPSYGIGGGTTTMSVENKRALFCALQCYLNSKVDELNNVTVPPVVATPTATVTPPVFVAPPQDNTEIDFTSSYAESQKQPVKESVSPMLKRMRELAGIPHPTNHV